MTDTPTRSRWGLLQGLATRLVGNPANAAAEHAGPARSFVLRPSSESGSWEAAFTTGVATWHGGQSSASRMTIRLIEVDDELLLLNGDRRRALMGVARVTRAAYPAPTLDEPSRLAIDLEPVSRVAPMVLLYQLRTEAQLDDCAMLRAPTPEIVRLSPGERRTLRRVGVP